ncbi:hypothetical protein [Gordonia sp. (in: high G+C Gram-positive bacteria)]|uniref:hypothetical protein n=1 Tax=Gordonia sp. (in: high G+C Gram-positive bacteria) TaxID=84139 RepID=UPI003C7169A5
MALIVGRLLAQLGIDDTGFSQGMNGARQDYQRTGQSAAQMAQQVEKSAAKVQSARAAEQAASVRVQAAEQALNKLRASGAQDALKLAQAEARLQSALASQNSAAVRAAEASRGLTSAQRQQAQSMNGSSQATIKATSETNNLASAAAVAKGALAAMGVAFSMRTIVNGLTQSVQAARALGAQTNQMTVIFGEGKAQIESWGSTAVDTMRMSQREAQGAAIQFATFGKAMGLAGDDLVQFSTEQTKLAADLASFQGIPVADAIQAMGSAYAGETETMRKYGVLLDENTIKTAAYENGVAAAGEQLTVQQKAQGAYFAMMEQLGHVNGDVERSNGKFGASMKTLTSRIEETQAAIGQKLIPIVHPFIDLLAGPGLSALQGVATVLGEAGKAFGSLPTPVQAALAAIVAFRIGSALLGTQIAGISSRVVGAFKGISQSATVMTSQGAVQMGRFGSSIAGIGQHVPTIARMQTAFVNAATGAARFPRAAGMASAAMTGMKGAASGLMGALGGPWGLAIAGATVALSMWISKKQKDKQASEAAEAATKGWTDSLRESNGELTKGLRSDIWDQIADGEKTVQRMAGANDTLAEALKNAGVSAKDAVDAISGNSEAWDRVRSKVKAYSDEVGKDRADSFVYRDTIDHLAKLGDRYKGAQSGARDLADATGDTKIAFGKGSEAAGIMGEAMTEFAESTDGAASKVDKLAKSLDGLMGDQLTEEEALQSWSDNMRDLVTAFGEAGSAAVKFDGHVDVTTEKGSKLQDAVRNQSSAYNETAAAALEAAKSQKLGAGETLDFVTKKLAPLRQSMIDTAVAAGVPIEQAKKMADVYLGLPKDIVTKLNLEGADAAIDKLTKLKVEGAKPVEMTYTMMDNTQAVREKLDFLKVKYSIIDGKIVINDQDIPKAQEALKKLGVQTEDLPEGFVKITDTSAENLAHLRELGIRTQTLPDGTIVINPDDAAFWNAVNRAQAPGKKTITIEYIDPLTGNSYTGGTTAPMVLKPEIRDRLQRQAPNADGSVRDYANGAVRGGIPSLPSEAVIEPGRGSGLVRWAEAAAGAWEAFIPGKKTARTISILSETARRLGFGIMPIRAYAEGAVAGAQSGQRVGREPYGLPAGTATDSIDVPWVQSVAKQFNLRPSTYAGHQETDGLNKGIDWFGSVPDMQQFAEYLRTIAPQMEQVIWDNPETGEKIGIADGQMVGPGTSQPGYYSDDWSGHQNHVHTRQSYSFGGNGTAAPGGTVQPVTLSGTSSRDDVARKIIAEGRARGYSDSEIQAVLATAIQESNLDPAAQGGGGAWHGIFQQDGSYAGRDDPNTNITGFYDRLDEKRTADPDADIYDQIFWLQQRPGDSSASAAVAAGRGGYMDEIKGQDGAAAAMLADLGPSVGGVGTDSGVGGVSGGGVGQNVYVTGGRLDSIGGSVGSLGGDSGTPSTGGGSGGGGGDGRRLFTIGGGWPFYNNNPQQPSTPSTPGTTGTPKRGTPPSASSLQAAQDAVEKAGRTKTEAIEKERIAQMKLDETRANPKAKPSQIASQEAALARAKNDVTDATDKLTVAEMRLQEIQAKGAPANAGTPVVKRLNGGTIPGTGRGDIIPMMGEPGEEVIRRSVAEKNRGALQHLNRFGRWPEFHQDGGTVGGFGGYKAPALARVGVLDHGPGFWMEQAYRVASFGYGAAAMGASAINADGSYGGLSTGASTMPILDDIAKKLDEVIKEGRVGSIGIYVGEGGQIVVDDMGDLRSTQDDAVQDAMMRSAVMR